MATDTIVERVRKLDTTSISDAMDRLGIECCGYYIKPINTGPKICGRAFTVHCVSCGVIQGTVGDFLDDVQPGQVIAIDNSGRDSCAIWGDIMARTVKLRGIEGTVVDGVYRDIPAALECGYPVFSRGYYIRTGKDRVWVDAVNTPMQLSDIPVYPDDIILGGDTGVMVIPRNMAKGAVRIAEEIEEEEQGTFKLVSQDMTLKDARSQIDYHHSQIRE